MLPEIAVVVPTYWTRAGGESRPGDAVYDHPTPVDQEGTLVRLIQSLTMLDSSRFYLLVVVAVTGLDVAADARRKVENIVRSVPQIASIVFGSEDLSRMTSAMGFSSDEAKELLGPQRYSPVRNIHLAVPVALGSDVIVALDDDEVVTDEHFLEHALEGLGGTVAGIHVDGVSGYYLQDQSGSILLKTNPEAERANNVFDRKAVIMNEATEKLQTSPGQLVETPFCFGGNMVFSRELASTIFFDPSITRGEDIDYLINARLAGKSLFLNKDLRVLHLPPPGSSYKDVAHHKVVADVVRFIYEREKLSSWQKIGAVREVSAQELSPYPGEFLTDGLDRDSHEVMERIWNELSTEGRKALNLGPSVDAFMDRAHDEAVNGVKKFSALHDAWIDLTKTLCDGGPVRDDLMQLVQTVRGRSE